MNTIYDVVIVGAGPAGSSAAYHLAKQGINVLLLDKCDFPRDKVCGDVLKPRCVSLLDEMGLLDQVVHMGHPYRAKKFIAPVGNTATLSLPQQDDQIPCCGLIVPRLLLDDLLRQHALASGAQFHSPVRVTDLLCDGNSVEVRGEYHRQSISYRASMVILAIGANCGLLLRTGLLTKMPYLALGMRAYFEGVTQMDGQGQFYLDGVFPPGFGWILPVSDSCANIGVGFLPSKRQTQGSVRGAFDAFVHTPQLRRVLARAHQSSPVRGFPSRCNFATSPTFGQRVMLVGEAAGLGHALTGEGIFYALDSGKLAAQHLGRMFASGDFSRQSLQGYDRHLRLRYQLFISLYANVRSLSLPFSSHRFIYTHGMNCAIESLHLAFRLPGAKRLFLYATGAAPHRYPLSLEALVRSTG